MRARRPHGSSLFMFRHLSRARLLLTYSINRYQMTPTCPISTIDRHPIIFVFSTFPERPEHSIILLTVQSSRVILLTDEIFPERENSTSSSLLLLLFAMDVSFTLHCKSNKTFFPVLLCMIRVMVHFSFCCSIYASRCFALLYVFSRSVCEPNAAPIRVRLYFNNSIKPIRAIMQRRRRRSIASRLLYLSDA